MRPGWEPGLPQEMEYPFSRLAPREGERQSRCGRQRRRTPAAISTPLRFSGYTIAESGLAQGKASAVVRLFREEASIARLASRTLPDSALKAMLPYATHLTKPQPHCPRMIRPSPARLPKMWKDRNLGQPSVFVKAWRPSSWISRYSTPSHLRG